MRGVRLQSLGLGREEFVWLTGSLCQINRLPFDPALLLQRFPAPHSVRQFLEALQSLGFVVGEASLADAALPCIGFAKGDPPRPAIFVRSGAPGLLYFEPRSQTPQT